MFSHSFSNLWLIIQHARSHGQWAGWGIFIVAALRCIEKHCIVLHGIALHYIETHPGSIHRSSSHREEMSRNAMKHGSVASITLMSCCGSWVTSFWGFLHSVLAQIYNRKQMLEETHTEPGWVWYETQARALMMQPVRWCEMWGWNFGIFDLQSRVKAVRRLQLGIL